MIYLEYTISIDYIFASNLFHYDNKLLKKVIYASRDDFGSGISRDSRMSYGSSFGYCWRKSERFTKEI